MDPENSRIDQEKAIQELVRGRELMDDLSRLVRGTLPHDDRSEQAGGYCIGVEQAIEVGISLVKSIDATVPLEFRSPTSILLLTNGVGPGSGVGSSSNSGDENPRDQGKRRVSHSKTTVTHSPFADGYQWRKYGQKVIRNVKYPRSYYRCSDAGCRAKLLVQQITDSGSLPMYELTRNNEHTCNAVMNPPPAFQHSSSSPATPMRESNIITFESYQSVPSCFARGANNTEQVHNLDFSSSVQQMQNRSGEMLSPGSSSDAISSSSSLLNLSVPAHSHQLAPDIENNFDSSFFPPFSPAGQFYGPDASAYL